MAHSLSLAVAQATTPRGPLWQGCRGGHLPTVASRDGGCGCPSAFLPTVIDQELAWEVTEGLLWAGDRASIVHTGLWPLTKAHCLCPGGGSPPLGASPLPCKEGRMPAPPPPWEAPEWPSAWCVRGGVEQGPVVPLTDFVTLSPESSAPVPA